MSFCALNHYFLVHVYIFRLPAPQPAQSAVVSGWVFAPLTIILPAPSEFSDEFVIFFLSYMFCSSKYLYPQMENSFGGIQKYAKRPRAMGIRGRYGQV